MRLLKILFLVFIGHFFLHSCNLTEKYKHDLLSDNVTTICKACYELGEARDTSSVKLLLSNILDPRISHDLRFKGMSVSQCRTGALKKISGIDVLRKTDEYIPDTTAVSFYLEWAVKEKHIQDKNEVDIYYFKQH